MFLSLEKVGILVFFLVSCLLVHVILSQYMVVEAYLSRNNKHIKVQTHQFGLRTSQTILLNFHWEFYDLRLFICLPTFIRDVTSHTTTNAINTDVMCLQIEIA